MGWKCTARASLGWLNLGTINYKNKMHYILRSMLFVCNFSGAGLAHQWVGFLILITHFSESYWIRSTKSAESFNYPLSLTYISERARQTFRDFSSVSGSRDRSEIQYSITEHFINLSFYLDLRPISGYRLSGLISRHDWRAHWACQFLNRQIETVWDAMFWLLMLFVYVIFNACSHSYLLLSYLSLNWSFREGRWCS
jgi:hypothetical protein